MSVLFLFTSMLYYSCESIEKKIYGVWVIEIFKLDGKELSIYEDFYVNLFDLKNEDNVQIIEFPIRQIGDNSKEFFFQTGNWSCRKESGKEFLTFSGALDDIFNSEFEMKLSSRKQGEGVISVMELISERIYMKSSKF